MLTFILYVLGGLSLLVGIGAVTAPDVSGAMVAACFGFGIVFFALGRILFVVRDIRDNMATRS